MKILSIFAMSTICSIGNAFVIPLSQLQHKAGPGLFAVASSTQESVTELKKVLEREYVSFFNPMRTEYYATDVTFDDPLTSLAGVKAYQANVDMLSGRTLLGSILFEDGSINLHSITGGEMGANGAISDITTRWTLRFTMKVWPWKPTARFSGVSIYKLRPTSGPTGVQIVGQADYWDSINMLPGGNYQQVSKADALNDFLNQLEPGGFQATPAAPELPYSLLRRGKDYEVRRYPAYTAIRLKYGRRDEGFGSLGAFTKGTESPLGPAVMTVESLDDKFMMWPLTYALPGATSAPEPNKALEKIQDPQWRKCQIITVPSQVVAVVDFTDVSMEPVVRKNDALLRRAVQRDGLVPKKVEDSYVKFAQYDAIFSMGKRRSEVWIDLEDGGHPW